ncbi:RNA 2',3'-cyclic phosphodiesterase [Microbulbifer sp. MLAF003]|uniref:RNA 2',3'-cyclic phosphodiesterase n=1 Tax=unclassified Microbulbifer TaxID=2619833 RepID=UPI0024AE58F3|nr:RNA 2',3'-cyclic phosphodiesterase [Microbulbifer sp. MLAF003]WHI49809.1 RNA 2',3'-cyclic phosphodiesterase [Microbulbifer sp. MLAF003]
MSKDSTLASKTSSRLFIGIRPPNDTQVFLDNLCARYKTKMHPETLNRIRWTSRQNRHLTLAFLGQTPSEKVLPIQKGLEEIAKNTMKFKGCISSITPFPQSNSKLLATELTHSPELLKAYEDCKRLIESLGMKPEELDYRPHITLARCRSGFSNLLTAALDHPLWLDNIILYQSNPAPESSHYQPLFETSLSGTEDIR